VLGVMDGQGVADSGTIDDHKDALSALESSAAATTTPAVSEESVADSGHTHPHAGKTYDVF